MYDKYKFITNKDLKKFEIWHNEKNKDWYNNQFHLSGHSGSINDPNGLYCLGGKFHIFLQNCPFSIEHHNKSRALYTTEAFVNYTYEGIAITPSCEYDKNGIFSGSARVNENHKVEFFYTEILKKPIWKNCLYNESKNWLW